MLLSLLYFCFVQISLLVPGYVLLRKTKIFKKQPGLELCMAYLATIVFFSFLATADYLFKLSPEFSRIICWLVIVAGVIEFFRARYYKNLSILRFPLLCMIAMSLFASLYMSLSFNGKVTFVPDPQYQQGSHYNVAAVKVINISQTRALDSYIPYRQAQFFVNRSNPAIDNFITEWGVGFFERTPLMGAVTANYFNLLNQKPPISFTWSQTNYQDPDNTYREFQVIANVLNTLFIIPAFYILTKFFNKKTATISCLFMVPSEFFLYNAVYSWPKSFVAFIILISWLLLLEKKTSYTILAGLAGGVAYLSHDLAILYIGGGALFLLYNKRYRDTLIYALLPLLFVIPWFILADFVYRRPSSFIYYPISTQGIPQPAKSKQIIHTFLHTSIFTLLKIRITSFIYLLSPYELLTSEGGEALFRRLWGFGLYSLPGSIGAGLMIPAYISVFKRIKGWSFWLLILGPVLFETIFIGWPKGLGILHFAEALVVLVTGIAIFYLLKLKSKWWLIGAYLVNTAQLALFVTYSYAFAVRVWLSHPIDIGILVMMAALVTLCGWLIYQSSLNKQNWLLP